MIWGAEEIKKSKKNFGGPSPGKKIVKKAFRGEKIWRGYREEKINSFSNFPPRPQIINGRPLNSRWLKARCAQCRSMVHNASALLHSVGSTNPNS